VQRKGFAVERARADKRTRIALSRPGLLGIVFLCVLATVGTGSLTGCGGASHSPKAERPRVKLPANSEEAEEAAAKAKEAAAEAQARKREEAEEEAARKAREAAEKAEARAPSKKKHKTKPAKRTRVRRIKVKAPKAKAPVHAGESAAEKAARKQYAKEEAQEVALFKKEEKSEAVK
jgi:hypothetical protein